MPIEAMSADTSQEADLDLLISLPDVEHFALQLGAGPLGLGHNIPVFDPCGLSTLIGTRINTSSNRERLEDIAARRSVRKQILAASSGSGRDDQLTPDDRFAGDYFNGGTFDLRIAGLIDTATDRGLKLLTAAISVPETSIIALALRNGLNELAPAIIQGLEHRSPLDRVTIISCENTYPSNWDVFKSQCREYAQVQVVDSVVDRICMANTERGGPDVFTEDFRLWTIQRDRHGVLAEVLAPQIKTGQVEIVDSLGPHKMAKRYLVNSLQLALALDGAYHGENLLHSHIRAFDPGDPNSFAEKLLKELRTALEYELQEQGIPPKAAAKFVESREVVLQPVRRLASFPDPIFRLLATLRPERKSEFDAAVLARLRGPHQMLTRHGDDAQCLTWSLGLAAKLWEDRAWGPIHGLWD
jgi:hypothetical protein